MTVVGFEPTNPLAKGSGTQSRRVCQFRHTVQGLMVVIRRPGNGKQPPRAASFPGLMYTCPRSRFHFSIPFPAGCQHPSRSCLIRPACRRRRSAVRSVRSLIRCPLASKALTSSMPRIAGPFCICLSTRVWSAFDRSTGGLLRCLAACESPACLRNSERHFSRVRTATRSPSRRPSSFISLANI